MYYSLSKAIIITLLCKQFHPVHTATLSHAMDCDHVITTAPPF